MEILFEDDEILVINKEAGFVTEGPEKDGVPSLASRIQSETGNLVFPCHRLDRDTSGVLVFAKKRKSLVAISEQFAKRKVRKSYLGCVEGEWNPTWNRVETLIRRNGSGKLVNGIKGKLSATTFRRLASWNDRSLIEALPKTGRTHQIRLHCEFQGCPILGDGLYGNHSESDPPMALHAWKLSFRHPSTGEPLQFKASVPDYWHDHWLKDCPTKIR